MCSHYTYKKDEAKLKLRDQILVFGFVPHGDIRPTDLGPVIIPEHDSFSGKQMSWGWSVPWDNKPLINAKSETITQLPTFKPHLKNRCLILADGFYEKGIRFVQSGEQIFAMAGLWQTGKTGDKFTMLTTTPNESVSPYHHRMPFILKEDQFDDWLGNDWHEVLANPDRRPLEKIQNQPELAHKCPFVRLAPLPSHAQFLNVIESVFSGMASAIIHNSNYQSLDEAMEAIDRYFAERNQDFRNKPRRAGGKIWGKELVAAKFNEANNCKNQRYSNSR